MQTFYPGQIFPTNSIKIIFESNSEGSYTFQLNLINCNRCFLSKIKFLIISDHSLKSEGVYETGGEIHTMDSILMFVEGLLCLA